MSAALPALEGGTPVRDGTPVPFFQAALSEADIAAVTAVLRGGWLTLGAYLLILWALSIAPLSGVAPLRESAAVFAAAWGSVRLGEAVGIAFVDFQRRALQQLG